MSPAERAQAVAMLSGAEAMRDQGSALMHLAEAQIRAANALLAADPPSVQSGDANGAVAEKIFGAPEPTKYYGSKNRVPPSDGESSGT